MALVTGIIVSGLFDEEEIITVKQVLDKFTKDQPAFVYVDPSKTGGTKPLESDLFLGSFNHFDAELFCFIFKELKGLIRDYVYDDIQVFVKNDSDKKWSIYSINQLSTKCFY